MINPSFLCSRLTVPMDYAHGEEDPDAPKVHLALLQLPAQQSQQSATNETVVKPPPSKSPLLINPGGPGGSGVLVGLLLGSSLQRVLGADQPIIGFDPRGIGFTDPAADCWAAPPPPGSCGRREDGDGKGSCDEDDAARGLMRRLQWDQVKTAYGHVGESEMAMRYLEVGHRGVNALCRERDERHGGASGLAWMSTEEVARDMARIVDKWDAWVDSEVGAGAMVEREMRGKLIYWGFSYGTYLGATFAKMFPDRVGRLLLDGVVDAELYEEPVWSRSLDDTDKVLGEFFRYCAAAKTKCALYRKGDDEDDIQRRYETVMETLETSPITFTHPDYFYPVILRESLIKMVVFQVLYDPIKAFPALAWVLNTIYEGKHEELSAMFQDAEFVCTLAQNPMLKDAYSDAQRAIMCTDKRQPVNMTLSEWTSAYKAMAETSQFAGIWISIMMQCNGWDLSPPHRAPREPWTSEGQIETANPILFVSNTYDPVTPLYAAVKMALKFKDAGLLEQKSLGHCTLAGLSRCTAKVVRDYLTKGKVPPPPRDVDSDYEGEWMQCEADEVPWDSVDPERLASFEAEERKIVEAWQQLQKAMESVKKWSVGKEKGDVEAVMEWFRKMKDGEGLDGASYMSKEALRSR
ncbi:TAP-like protein-domain-containing protein [Corynascus similis CBS 632.67]